MPDIATAIPNGELRELRERITKIEAAQAMCVERCANHIRIRDDQHVAVTVIGEKVILLTAQFDDVKRRLSEGAETFRDYGKRIGTLEVEAGSNRMLTWLVSLVIAGVVSAVIAKVLK